LPIGGEDVAELFKVQGVLPDDFIPLPTDDPLNIKTIKTGHIPKYGYNLALFVADKILYSGDSNESVLDTEYAKQAAIIFHETTLSVPYAHSVLDVLNQAAPGIKAKTWLAHIDEKERSEIGRLAKEYGFAGVCKNGQEIGVL
jgi:ribonuclease BN (tRNA processing enzyme)